jgi:cysteinyl-tRNA synthetase
LMVDADKMSKSLANFKTIRQTVSSQDIPNDQAGYTANPREAEMLRFFIVRNHYRSIQNYTPANLADAQHALDRLYQTLQAHLQADPNATSALVETASTNMIDWSTPTAQAFASAMNDDFNTAGAVAVLFDLAAQANRGVGDEAAQQLKALGGVLGLLQTEPSLYLKSTTRYTRRALEQSQLALKASQVGGDDSHDTSSDQSSDKLNVAEPVTLSDTQIEALVQERSDAKGVKDFKRADDIRSKLSAAGILLEDKPGGVTHWQRG